MRIFIGLTEVSGYYANLKRGFDELGVPATYVTLHAHPFGYGELGGQTGLPALARYCVERRVALANRRSLRGAFWLAMVLLTRVPLLLWALARFDVFILGGGSSFLRRVELPLLRLLGKRVIYMFHGTDSRPGYIDGFCEGIPRLSESPFEELSARAERDPDAAAELAARVRGYLKATRRRWSNVRWVERFADVVISHPAHGHFHTRPFAMSLIVGLPYQFRGSAAGASGRSPDPSAVRVLHSPSQPEGKGTYAIRRAIEAVRRRGVAIELVEITGRPNAEVLEELRRCDFVVDQAFSDYPMAAFAMEAAFFGKPAVVGGYYADRVGSEIAEEWIPPTEFCHPDRIAEAIERLARDPAYREDLGARARDFVQRNWAAREVAARYLRLIRGDVPREWLFDPREVRYALGIGQPEVRTRAILRAILERHGTEALRLTDKPDLEALFVALARGGEVSGEPGVVPAE